MKEYNPGNKYTVVKDFGEGDEYIEDLTQEEAEAIAQLVNGLAMTGFDAGNLKLANTPGVAF